MKTTKDAFLGGRLVIEQPAKGFRAGVDAVLLAAACPAQAGQSVLELGCGVGTAAFCLARRVEGLSVTGVELQPDYAALARSNAVANQIALDVHCADLAYLPPALRDVGFDHVIANPPYYERARSSAATDAGREAALGEDTPLSAWMDVATRRLKPKGVLTMIQKAARLPHVLGAMDARLGSVRVRPVAARTGRCAELVIVQARKGGRADFRLDAPLIMHDGAEHGVDGDDYSLVAQSILREGAALDWPR